MTTIEALRLQLDNLQKEKQELEVRNLKLSENHCNREAVVELEKERDQWKEDWERVTVENVQLKTLYEEAPKHMSDNETNSTKSANYCCFTRANRSSLSQCSMLEV